MPLLTHEERTGKFLIRGREWSPAELSAVVRAMGDEMTAQQRRRFEAILRHGTIRAAAEEMGLDAQKLRMTVSCFLRTRAGRVRRVLDGKAVPPQAREAAGAQAARAGRSEGHWSQPGADRWRLSLGYGALEVAREGRPGFSPLYRAAGRIAHPLVAEFCVTVRGRPFGTLEEALAGAETLLAQAMAMLAPLAERVEGERDQARAEVARARAERRHKGGRRKALRSQAEAA